jgi:hypothetical protein
MKNIIRKVSCIKPKNIFLALLALVFLVPVLAIGGHRHQIHVDDSNNGAQDGSSEHPYKTIKKAMEKADSKTDIVVANGEYEENVKIKEGVKLFGSDRDKTVIKADNDNEPAVKMRHKTQIGNFTIKGGEDGVKVENDAQATISQCDIKDNDEDGVDVGEAQVRDSRKVVIMESEIRGNGKAGIYSRKRQISITDNKIVSNGSNGVDIEKGSGVWIKGNDIKKNGGSGMKIRLDDSKIFAKSNAFRDNERNGVEISFAGKYGTANFNKTEITGNDHYGVAKIQKGVFANNVSLWNRYLTITSRVGFGQNGSGNVSGIIVEN